VALSYLPTNFKFRLSREVRLQSRDAARIYRTKDGLNIFVNAFHLSLESALPRAETAHLIVLIAHNLGLVCLR
jgi:hypothetical protein